MTHVMLEELLKKKKEANQRSSTHEIDWEGRKNAWLDRINQLFNDIKDWLNPLLEKRLIEFNDTESIGLNERHIGSYEAPIIEMISGTDLIRLSPIATLIVGSHGRIDMHGPKGRKLMLVLSDTDRPATTRIRISMPDEVVNDPHPGQTPNQTTRSSAKIIRDDCKWYFVDPSERTRKILVNKKSFEAILVGMLQP